MKKILLFASALAGLFLAASCQQEMLSPAMGGDANVTFNVAAGDVATKADIADGTNVDILHWEIYGDINQAPLGEGSVNKTTDKHFTVELKLVADQNYTIIFWAEVEGKGHYVTDDLRKVAINTYADEKANDETRAAFFAVYSFDTENGESIKEDIYLYRPFSQINLGATTYETSFNLVQGGLKVESTEMTVNKIANVFNTITGMGETEGSFDGKVTFKANDDFTTPNGSRDATEKLLTVNNVTYYWLGMNYLIVTDNSDNVNVDVVLNTNLGTVNHSISSVPVKENFRTNILGNFLTTDATFEVIVDENFEAPEIVIGSEWTQTGVYEYLVNESASQTALKEILAHADAEARRALTKSEGPVVTINLNGNVEWETGGGIGSTPLLAEDSPISAVVINGNGKTFTATGAGVGAIRLANGGQLTFNNVKIVDKSVSYDEGSWELGYLEFEGNIVFDGCDIVNAIMVSADVVDFRNTTLNSNAANQYAAWVDNGTVNFTKCTVKGPRGIKIHECYSSVVTGVTFDGCTFDKLSEKPGIAIGDIWAPGADCSYGGSTWVKPSDAAITEITIKNSTFNQCQAGDQKNYMYETDTPADPTTLILNLENNTVIPSGDALVEQADGSVAVATTESLDEAIAKDYTTIRLAEGVYVIPDSAKGKTLKFIGTGNPEDTKIATDNVTGSYEGCNYALDGSTVTFENISINTPSSLYIGYARCNGTYNNCVFNGTYTLYGVSEFNNCTFNVSGDVYNVWTWGAPTATFNDCTFNSDGKAMLLYGTEDTKLTINRCTFNDNGGLEDLKAAVEIGNDYGTSYTLVVNDTEVNGYEVNDKGIVTGTTLWANKNSMGTDKLSVTVDGLKWIGGLLYTDAEGNVVVDSAAALTAALAEHTSIILKPGVYEGKFDIKKDGTTINGKNAAFVGCINLNGKDNVTLKNIKFDAAIAEVGYDGKGNEKQYANIISGSESKNGKGTVGLLVEGCSFTGTFADGGVAIAFTDQGRGSGQSGNITIKGCTFATDGGYCDIYTYYSGKGYCNIEGNVFGSNLLSNAIYLGRYQSKTPVVVKGNDFKKAADFDAAAFIQDHSTYGVSFDASENTFAN